MKLIEWFRRGARQAQTVNAGCTTFPEKPRYDFTPVRIKAVADYLKLVGMTVVVTTRGGDKNPKGDCFRGRIKDLSDSGDRLILENVHKDHLNDWAAYDHPRLAVPVAEIDFVEVIDRGCGPSENRALAQPLPQEPARNEFPPLPQEPREAAIPIQVADPWGVGGPGPFILERKPDMAAILSAPNPKPPKPETQWNSAPSIVIGGDPSENTRGYLAMAYMRHPDAEVRAATIRFVGSHPRKKLMVGLVLAQRLAIDREDLQRVAAEAIWKRGREELQETMNYLAGNDESPGDDGNGASVMRGHVRTALQILHDANPSGEKDFKDALLHGWCWHDDRLAGLGRQLIEVWFDRKTFLDERSKKVAGSVGADIHSIGGLDAMKMMFRPVTLLAGTTAAAELNHAWSGIGGWQP